MNSPEPNAGHAARRRWMSVMSRASAAAIADHLSRCPELPAYVRLRGPETGLVMLRGRAGGGGGKFNLGEVTVTRCTVRTEGGQVGHCYATGRDTGACELAARVDAAMQDPALHDVLESGLIRPLERAQHMRRDADARRAAATRVEFFTMATMRTT